ncbi:hypothetical protein QOZ80_8BG0651170 [Eleusine coracana subsp. coracana]|nr:hypothetical protein QOZ80_8BG0651170 [Eleusine coracana subsp. coracana]
MAVDLLGHAFGAGEQLAFQEAAAAGLRSLELLASSLSPRAAEHRAPPQIGQIADQAVSRFRRVINLLDRTGHARFRRAPAVPLTVDSPPASPRPAPAPAQKSLTLDFTKPAPAPAVSGATSTSFLSSVTAGGGEGSVSKGQNLAAVSSGKPPLPKRKQPHPAATCSPAAAPSTHAHAGCHCSRKRRKHPRGATRTVRVPAPAPSPASAAKGAAAAAEIPSDEYSWRKYGQKPIKGSPFPRGYYRCSTVKGCPARKHVERDAAEPNTLIVTYENEHRHHDAAAIAAAARVA